MADGGAGARHLAGMRPAIGVACAAYAFCVAMLGSTPPTPLYPIYQQRLGYGHLLTTVVLAVYAGGVIVALLLFGRASDLLGRRPILLVGLAVSALSAGGFLIVGGVPELLAARLPSDVSVGLVTATATVALVEPVRPRRRTAAALPAAVVNMFGLGCGPAGLLAEYGPRPLRMPFEVDLVLPAAAMVRRTADARDGAHPYARPAAPAAPGDRRRGPPMFVPAAPPIGGTIVVGVGQSLSFRAGVTAVTERIPGDERAETVASFSVVVYAGVALPVVLVGAAVAPLVLRDAAIAFTAGVGVLALAALVTVLRLDHPVAVRKPG